MDLWFWRRLDSNCKSRISEPVVHWRQWCGDTTVLRSHPEPLAADAAFCMRDEVNFCFDVRFYIGNFGVRWPHAHVHECECFVTLAGISALGMHIFRIPIFLHCQLAGKQEVGVARVRKHIRLC